VFTSVDNNNTMGVLPKTLFSGTDNISESDKRKIFVNNFSDNIESVLGEFLWDGTAAGTIGLTISDDGKKVESGRFITRGVLEAKTIKMAASNIWVGADESLILSVKLPRAELFRFSEGGLYSQYVDEDSVNHTLHSVKEGQTPIPILPGDKEEWSVGNFCIRQVCCISKNSTARGGVLLTWTVLIFPRAKEQLLEASDLTSSPSWPGLRLISGEMPLMPRPTTAWGCPVLPILRSNNEDRTIPNGATLRHAVGAIMEKTSGTDIMRDVQQLDTRWKTIADNPLNFTEKPVSVNWPKQLQPEPETGKYKLCPDK
jgi:hypothetical protein